MSKRILISGGGLREGGFELGDGRYYDAARLLSLDLDSGEIELLLEITQANEHYPAEHPNLQFTVGCRQGEDLWLPTDTEIHRYAWPSLQRRQVISHPCFQNIHSVHYLDGRLWVTATGLDMVVVLDPDSGGILTQLNAEHKAPWHRFSPDVDYRQVHSTRPHDCHPNYVFRFDGDYWVTRCTQEDAVCLQDPTRRIDISGPDKVTSVHDGVVVGDRVYFTSVDGCLVIADPRAGRVLETIDICEEQGLGRLGWCRGLHIEADVAYLGFSSIRRTRQTRKLAWLGSSLSRIFGREACVLAYDLTRRRLLGRYDVPHRYVDAIYGLMPGG